MENNIESHLMSTFGLEGDNPDQSKAFCDHMTVLENMLVECDKKTFFARSKCFDKTFTKNLHANLATALSDATRKGIVFSAATPATSTSTLCSASPRQVKASCQEWKFSKGRVPH